MKKFPSCQWRQDLNLDLFCFQDAACPTLSGTCVRKSCLSQELFWFPLRVRPSTEPLRASLRGGWSTLQVSVSLHSLPSTFTLAVHYSEILAANLPWGQWGHVLESSRPGEGTPCPRTPPLPRAWHLAWLLLQGPHLALKLYPSS